MLGCSRKVLLQIFQNCILISAKTILTSEHRDALIGLKFYDVLTPLGSSFHMLFELNYVVKNKCKGFENVAPTMLHILRF